MGEFANGRAMKVAAWALFGVIAVANVWLVGTVLGGNG
jgi:manganese transport protein